MNDNQDQGRAINEGYISTVSGHRFYFENIDLDAIVVTDIAHALGNLCRFTGQCRQFYSVAEHSVHVSMIVPPELALAGLLHDATEAYCADIAKPLKRLLPDYNRMEDHIWHAIADRFDLPHEMHDEIKKADMAMLKLEVDRLLPRHCGIELNLPGAPAKVNLAYWAPAEARYFFLARYNELVRG